MKIEFTIDWSSIFFYTFWTAMLAVPFLSGYIVYQLDKAEFRANLVVQYPEPEPVTSYCHWLPDESGFVCVTQTAAQMLKEQADVY